MKKSFVIIFASLLMNSCATIFTGTKDKITFNSIPVGATVYKGGVEQCQTPCSINMQRSVGNTDIEYKLNGYETRLITLEKKLNPVSYINLLNLAGWAIDAVSGSVMEYDKKAYDITLSKKN